MNTTHEYLEAFHNEHTGMIDGGPMYTAMSLDGCSDAQVNHAMIAAANYNRETARLDTERLERAVFDAHCEVANVAALVEIDRVNPALLALINLATFVGSLV